MKLAAVAMAGLLVFAAPADCSSDHGRPGGPAESGSQDGQPHIGQYDLPPGWVIDKKCTLNGQPCATSVEEEMRDAVRILCVQSEFNHKRVCRPVPPKTYHRCLVDLGDGKRDSHWPDCQVDIGNPIDNGR
jgi:hypothetical protein